MHSDHRFAELRSKLWKTQRNCLLLGCDKQHPIQIPGGFGAAGAPNDQRPQTWRFFRRAWLRKAMALPTRFNWWHHDSEAALIVKSGQPISGAAGSNYFNYCKLTFWFSPGSSSLVLFSCESFLVSTPPPPPGYPPDHPPRFRFPPSDVFAHPGFPPDYPPGNPPVFVFLGSMAFLTSSSSS